MHPFLIMLICMSCSEKRRGHVHDKNGEFEIHHVFAILEIHNIFIQIPKII